MRKELTPQEREQDRIKMEQIYLEKFMVDKRDGVIKVAIIK